MRETLLWKNLSNILWLCTLVRLFFLYSTKYARSHINLKTHLIPKPLRLQPSITSFPKFPNWPIRYTHSKIHVYQRNLSAEQWNLTAEQWNLSAERWNFTAEQRKLSAEQWNFTAEQRNLSAERWNFTAEQRHLLAEQWNFTAEQWTL